MPQFTQLNLNDKSTKCGAGIPARETACRSTKTAMFAGLVAIAIVSGSALLALNGCSKKETVKSEATPATQPNISPSTTSAITPSLPATEAQAPKPVKKPKKSPSVTYVNRTYGLSLQYPRKYSLKTGDDAELELNGSSMPMDFAKPGGVTVAAFEMPRALYPGTDLNQAFLMVNVNRNLSAGECELQPQTVKAEEMKPVSATNGGEVKPIFAGGKPVSNENSSADVRPVSDEKQVSDSKQVSEEKLAESSSEKVKIGGREFTHQEKDQVNATSQSETRYYHVFESGSCYEFALGLATTPSESENETKPVDRDAVFGKLEKILATVKIKSPVEPTESSKQVVGESSVPAPQPANMNSSSSQVVEQKFEPTPVHPER